MSRHWPLMAGGAMPVPALQAGRRSGRQRSGGRIGSQAAGRRHPARVGEFADRRVEFTPPCRISCFGGFREFSPPSALPRIGFFDLSTGVSPINPTIYPQEISSARSIFLAANRAACKYQFTVRRLRTWTGARPLEPEQIGSGRKFQDGERRFGDRADEEGFSDPSPTASEPWSLRGGGSRGSLHTEPDTLRGERHGEGVRVCRQRHDARTASKHLTPSFFLAPDHQKQRARATMPGPRQRQGMHPRPTHLCLGVYPYILWNATKYCGDGRIFLNALGAQGLGGNAPDGSTQGHASRKAVTAASNARGLSACSQCPEPGILTKRASGKSDLIRLRCSAVT